MKQPPPRLGEHPVRKIGKNHRSITGALASSKAPPGSRYESALERDFYVRLDFDSRVAR